MKEEERHCGGSLTFVFSCKVSQIKSITNTVNQRTTFISRSWTIFSAQILHMGTIRSPQQQTAFNIQEIHETTWSHKQTRWRFLRRYVVLHAALPDEFFFEHIVWNSFVLRFLLSWRVFLHVENDRFSSSVPPVMKDQRDLYWSLMKSKLFTHLSVWVTGNTPHISVSCV